MAPPKYKDLGKSANDILNEDFKFEHSFEVKSKFNGFDIKSTFCDKGKGLTGAMEFKKGVASVGDVTVKSDHAFDDPTLTIENSSLMKGLKLKADVPCLPAKLTSKGITISPEYKHDLLMLTAKTDTKKKSSVVDVCFAAGPATAGVKTTLGIDGKATGTEAAVQYKAGSINVFAKYEKDTNKASGSLHTSLNSDLAVAMSASVGPEKGSKETSVDVVMGAHYTIDGANSVKGKVDKKGILSVCYVSKARKDLELKVTASIDSGNLSQSNKHQWGVFAIMSM
jgi:voltage-dependent anion channel protein 2